MRCRDQKDGTPPSLLKKYSWSQCTVIGIEKISSELVIVTMPFSAVVPNYSARPDIYPTRAFPFKISLVLPD